MKNPARWPLLALGCGAVAIGSAAEVTLSWDPSPDAVSGYQLYYQANHQFNPVEVLACGDATTATVTNLTEGWTYWFTCTAVGTNQVESDFSNVVQYTASPEGTNDYPMIGDAPVPPGIHFRTLAKLTPVVARSIDGAPAVETELQPTYVEATNSTEFFKALRIEKMEVVPRE